MGDFVVHVAQEKYGHPTYYLNVQWQSPGTYDVRGTINSGNI